MPDEKDVRTPHDGFLDKVDRKVRVGDFIAYGHALGRCAGLRIGKVLRIERVKRAYTSREEWSIGVRGIDEDGPRGPALCRSNGNLQFPDRIVKLNAIPEEFERLLEDV